ncbi:hypothetical protein CC1G_14699 [Coprinopsis cinerea okayama7|uniref:Uncharacterized protein n=1 Tax=Coprinopsis cinerea (strain Okayama-7 / 130 / ATCC MYA-4618 / FGSC 9003) TaxID=240176 RepID=D6RML3_COPC7|nr:hypothetical protein CC1G_14699 [Coprinopsis cinerea okayama7\|eukprot:XP_002911270.1 hypothetical protein CC1G_14699 [Coprinopsis cinerea okayama7\
MDIQLDIPEGASSIERWFAGMTEPLLLAVMGSLPISATIALGRTSKRLARVVRVYESRIWCFYRFLDPWMLNPKMLLVIMELAAAVCSGLQSLRFLDRLGPDLSKPLMIYVRFAGAKSLARHLLENGYFLEGTSTTTDGWKKAQRRVSCVGATLDPSAGGFRCLDQLHFMKTGPNGAVTMVNIIITNGDPIDYVVNTAACSMLEVA